MRKKVWLIVLVCMLAFGWCSATALAYEVKTNDGIAQELRDNMEELSTKLFTAINDYDSSVIDELFTENAKMANEENGLTTDDFIDQAYEYLQGGDVELINEYQINFDATEAGKEQVDLTVEPGDNADYFLNVSLKPLPAYIMIYQTFGSGSMESTIALGFYQINNEWKLEFFLTGLSLIDGKLFSDWYQDAKASYENGQLIPAALQLSLANYLVEGVSILQYVQADEINDLNAKVQTEIGAKYTFPVELADVEGKPQIFGIQSQYYENSICPVISYITKKELSDVDGLQAEAEAMIKPLEKMFPGITQMSSKILFDAFLETPTSEDAEYATSVVLLEN